MTTPADILRAARALISDPEKWCQYSFFEERPDGTRSRSCSGAIGQIASDTAAIKEQKNAAFAPLARGMGIDPRGHHPDYLWRRIETWQDRSGCTHAEVLDAFDRAIALAEQSV